MTTFDLAAVQSFVADLDARMTPVATTTTTPAPPDRDGMLRDHAALCHEFVEEIRAWGQAVFTGRIGFEEPVEVVFRAEGARLAARAATLQGDMALTEDPILIEDFRENVARLNKFLDQWIRPQLAVSPGPRSWMHITPEMAETIRRRVAELPPLPADWLPDDPDQRARLLALRADRKRSGAAKSLNGDRSGG